MIPIPVVLILAALLVASANQHGELSKYYEEMKINLDGGFIR